MKRSEIIGKLINEGLSEKTLSKLTDNQINILATRMLSEQDDNNDEGKGTTIVKSTSPDAAKIAKDLNNQGVNVSMTEDLKGNQKKLDKNHNGKIDGQDFKILKGQKDKTKTCDGCGKEMSKCTCDEKHLEETKPSAGLTKKEKSDVVKKAKHGGDIGKKGKGFEKLADKAAKEYGSKEKGQKVAAAAMWKNVQREGAEKQSWVKNLVENEYFHNFTSKGEIMELINAKLNEDTKQGLPDFLTSKAIKSAQTTDEASAPTTKPKPTTKPTTKPGKPKHDPYNPGPKPNPGPQAEAAPTTKPKPTTKPTTKPGKPKHDPYNPGPKPNPGPQAEAKKAA
jgi:hypothetical protein